MSKYTYSVIKLIIILIILIAVVLNLFACKIALNRPPQIAALKASDLYIYPTGTTELQCIVTDPEGDKISFRWSANDGSFTGNGPVVTWKAPNKYGDFHIMVVVDDINGNSSRATVTIKVVVNENQQQGCSSCPR